MNKCDMKNCDARMRGFVPLGRWCLAFVILLSVSAMADDERSPTGRKSSPLEYQRSRVNITNTIKQSGFSSTQAQPTSHEPRLVRPPRINSFYESQGKEAEYLALLDAEINKLYELSVQYKRSQSRGQIWLRLAEAYGEKAKIISLKLQEEYEKKIKDFNNKKTRVRPSLDTRIPTEFNRKAIQLYEWFLKDFPQDRNADQALFFLGYNYFEMGSPEKGEAYYKRLLSEYPNSLFIIESHFALAEYYFENDKWQDALDSYVKVLKKKQARFMTFASYKAAWCLYRLNRVATGLKMLEQVIIQSRQKDESSDVGGNKRVVNKVRLAQEALKEYVPFYAEVGSQENARREFERVARDPETARKMLERLAYFYADSGKKTSAEAIFKDLISENPLSVKASEYQYQIVLMFQTHDQKRFREELILWLESFGPSSPWAKANANDKELLAEAERLQETTLRQHILSIHQTAQKTKTAYSQEHAHLGYQLYMKYFAHHAHAVEMQYFHADLLFDMNKFSECAQTYLWVVEQDKSNQFREKSAENAALALEKDLPSSQSIDEKRGKSLDPIPLDPSVVSFEEGAQVYFKVLPRGNKALDIKRRLAVLYYSYNHFDKAIPLFEEILQKDPGSLNGEIAGNLLLDIYKLKGDMRGLNEKAHQLLSQPGVSRSKFGDNIRTILEKSSFLIGQKLADKKDYKQSAVIFEKFSQTNPSSALALTAHYNAGVNYEKSGNLGASIRNHQAVVAVRAKDEREHKLQNESHSALARIYSETGQLELAAAQFEKYAKDNPKDPQAINAYFNAALIFDSLDDYAAATRNYEAYMAKSRKSDRYEPVFYQAEIARRRGRLPSAVFLYKQYLDTRPSNREHVIRAHFEYARASEKLGRPTKAKEGFQATIAVYQALQRANRDIGVRYAAESRFNLSQEVVGQIKQIRFTSSDKQQAEAAGELKRLKAKYIQKMKEVIQMDYGPMIIAALTSSGDMFVDIAGMFERIPVPRGFSPEDGKKYKELIQVEVNSLLGEAKASYKAAWDKAEEIQVYGEWSRRAHKGLARLDGAHYSETSEIDFAPSVVDWMGL